MKWSRDMVRGKGVRWKYSWRGVYKIIRLKHLTKSKLWGKTFLLCAENMGDYIQKTFQGKTSTRIIHSETISVPWLTDHVAHWLETSWPATGCVGQLSRAVVYHGGELISWKKKTSDNQCRDQSRKENVAVRSVGHLYIPYAEPVLWGAPVDTQFVHGTLCTRCLIGPMHLGMWNWLFLQALHIDTIIKYNLSVDYLVVMWLVMLSALCC